MNSTMEGPSDPPEGEKYGKAVKRLLTTAGLKQDQLAASVPMSPGNVSKILNDDNTLTASRKFHDSVIAFLGLPKEGEQARYLETLHQAAANLNSLHYWRDETKRWQQEAKCLTHQVDEARKDRSAAQNALTTLQEQLDHLVEEMNQALNRVQEERDELCKKIQQQKIQLTQAGKYIKAHDKDLRIAQEETRRLGQQVRVLQHQLRLLQEELTNSQAISMVETTAFSAKTAGLVGRVPVINDDDYPAMAADSSCNTSTEHPSENKRPEDDGKSENSHEGAIDTVSLSPVSRAIREISTWVAGLILLLGIPAIGPTILMSGLWALRYGIPWGHGLDSAGKTLAILLFVLACLGVACASMAVPILAAEGGDSSAAFGCLASVIGVIGGCVFLGNYSFIMEWLPRAVGAY